MVGGGTGITPLYQVIQYVTEAEAESERPALTLLFANRTEDDILVK
jgi:NAD(P)H-flavin reductase